MSLPEEQNQTDTTEKDESVSPPPVPLRPTSGSHVEAVSVKIPPFWVDRPEVWFYTVEAQFKLAYITSEETKFTYLLAQMDPKYVDNILDIVRSRSTKKFSEAKARLLSTFRESESKKIHRLLNGVELGDLKPSQLLRKMQSLIPDKNSASADQDFSDQVLRTLWLDKMPAQIRNVIIVSNSPLEQLADMADRIYDITPRSEMAAVGSAPEETSAQIMYNALFMKIQGLEKQIAALSVNQPSENRHRYPERRRGRPNRSRSRSRRRYDPNGSLCFYHYRFGARCLPEKCKPPCSWTPGNPSQQ